MKRTTAQILILVPFLLIMWLGEAYLLKNGWPGQPEPKLTPTSTPDRSDCGMFCGIVIRRSTTVHECPYPECQIIDRLEFGDAVTTWGCGGGWLGVSKSTDLRFVRAEDVMPFPLEDYNQGQILADCYQEDPEGPEPVGGLSVEEMNARGEDATPPPCVPLEELEKAGISLDDIK